MTDYISPIFTSVVGLSVSGIIGVLVLTAIRIASRHSVLIYGSVAPEGEFRFRFRLQNLEEVQYPGKFTVTITGTRPASSTRPPILRVIVFAGPQYVQFTKKVAKEGESNESKIIQWVASFDGFPPYDAWLFNCDSNCHSLALTIDTGQRSTWLKQRIQVDLYPTSLKINSGDQENRYAGARTTPPNWILYSISIASLLVYLAFSFSKLNDAEEIYLFIGVSILLVVFLSAGFLLFRRPVYPIIQGYLAVTRAVDSSKERRVEKLVPRTVSPTAPRSASPPPGS